MSSKASILKAIRAQSVPATELPSLDRDWLRYADRFAQFQAQVEGVGGCVVRLASAAEIGPWLTSLESFATARQIVSLAAGVQSNVDLAQVTDPHALETVDWAIMPGEFGVAENGAIWATDEHVKHRSLYFIVQHLALVLPADQIVDNMHQAYARLRLGTSSLGVFISGPSKTADIEQSLVIGAHGPRSLTVFCVG